MINIFDEQFQDLINRAFDSLPKMHRDRVQNVAILFADVPDEQQRRETELRPNETLLGLYQGIPLSKRQGRISTLPDRITLFKYPLLAQASDDATLYDAIRHTLWHEVAHYYGLDHTGIHQLENNS